MKKKFLILILLQTFNLVNATENKLLYSDWIKTDDPKFLCGGFYVEPEYHYSVDKSELPLIIEADNMNFSNSEKSTISGDVNISFGNKIIKTESAEIYRKNNKIEKIVASNYSSITEPGIRLDGLNLFFDNINDVKNIENANYRLYANHARGVSDNITLYGSHKIKLKNATYTTCSPCNNTWALKAKSIDVDFKKGRGYAKHAHLKIKDTPVFYLPYINFALNNERKTGFLTPHFGNTNRSGKEIIIPFYLNLAPNYDLTVSPRVLSKRGIEIQNHFRYLTYHSYGEIKANILPHDKSYDDFRKARLKNHPKIANDDPRIKALEKDSARHIINLYHYTRFNRNWNGQINYNHVSDDNYFADLGNTIGSVSTNQVLQNARLNYHDENWIFNGQLQQYQMLYPYESDIGEEPYQMLPELLMRSQHLDLPIGFRAKTTSSFVYFHTTQDAVTGNSKTNGFRYNLKPELYYPLNAPGYHIVPRAQLDILIYDLSTGDKAKILNQPEHSSRVIPIFDLDTKLFFERFLSIGNSDLIHTLEPRLYFLYIPFRDQNKLPIFDTGILPPDYNTVYSDKRFSGVDRLGDTKQVTLGLSTKFFTAHNGEQKLSLDLNQIYYMQNNKVTLCHPGDDSLCNIKEDNNKRFSNLMMTLTFSHHNYLNSIFNFEWNHYEGLLDKQSIYLQYHPSEWNVFNFGYQYLRQNPSDVNETTGKLNKLQQINTSVAWQLNDNFRAINSVHYDLLTKQLNNFWIGIEHQGCCTALRLGGHRFFNPNKNASKKYFDGVFFQFVFKGLDSIGHSYRNLSEELIKVIPGYKWRDNILQNHK